MKETVRQMIIDIRKRGVCPMCLRPTLRSKAMEGGLVTLLECTSCAHVWDAR